MSGESFFNDGVSIVGGLSVSGESFFYNGVSIVGGLSVSGQARLEKISSLDFSVPGIPSNTKTLGLSESGTTYFVNHGRDTTKESITFILPEPTQPPGLNYKFITTTGISSGDKIGTSFPSFGLSTGNQGDYNKLHGIININEIGTSRSYSIATGDHPNSLNTSYRLLLRGPIFEGTNIECISNGLDWYIQGDVGVSIMSGVSIIGNYGISGTVNGLSVFYGFQDS